MNWGAGRYRCLLSAAVALVLVVGACGGSDTEADVPSGVLATVEGFTEAVNAYDTDAVRGLVTEDYSWQSTGPVQDLDAYVAYVDTNYEAVGFHVEVTAEREVRLDGEVYVVEEPGVVKAGGAELAGTTVHRLVEVGDDWLIQQTRWAEDTSDATG